MNRMFSLSACNMGLGLAHLRLTGQMRCPHFAGSVKFSAKDITQTGGCGFFDGVSPVNQASQKFTISALKILVANGIL